MKFYVVIYLEKCNADFLLQNLSCYLLKLSALILAIKSELCTQAPSWQLTDIKKIIVRLDCHIDWILHANFPFGKYECVSGNFTSGFTAVYSF